MGLGGPNLVKGATGQVIDAGAARRRAPAHRRQRRGALHGQGRCRLPGAHSPALPPVARASGRRGRRPMRRRRAIRPASTACCPPTTACPTKSKTCIFRIFDGGDYAEFQPEYAPEMLCADARLSGRPVAVDRQPPRLSEGAGAAAHRRHHLHRIGAQGGLFRRNQPSAWAIR